MKTKHAIKALVALGHSSRLAIYDLLVTKGEEGIPAGEIAKKLDIPGTTLSFHLSNLADAKIVKSRREGRTIYYFVRYERVQELIAYLSENCCIDTSESCAVDSPSRPKPCS